MMPRRDRVGQPEALPFRKGTGGIEIQFGASVPIAPSLLGIAPHRGLGHSVHEGPVVLRRGAQAKITIHPAFMSEVCDQRETVDVLAGVN